MGIILLGWTSKNDLMSNFRPVDYHLRTIRPCMHAVRLGWSLDTSGYSCKDLTTAKIYLEKRPNSGIFQA